MKTETLINPKSISQLLVKKYPDGVAVRWTENGGLWDGIKLKSGEYIINTCYQDTTENCAKQDALVVAESKAIEDARKAAIEKEAVYAILKESIPKDVLDDKIAKLSK